MFINPMFRQSLLHTTSTRAATGLNLRPAFTLIELLVVISIIVVLVAILLPALSSARVASQRTVSISNVRQITLAQHMYTNDFKGSFPFLKQTGINSVTKLPLDSRFSSQWSKMLVDIRYLSSPSVYWSPGRAQSFATGISGPGERTEFLNNPRPTAYSYESVGYGMNTAVAGGTEFDMIAGSAQPPLRLGEAQAPRASDMLLLAESWSTSGNTATPVGSINGMYLIMANNRSKADTRLFNYNGGVVRSYVDGRAHAMVSRGTNGRYVSGDKADVGKTPFVTTHADDIGWDVYKQAPTPILEGPYAGRWSLYRNEDVYFHAPWFRDWRIQWHAGLR